MNTTRRQSLKYLAIATGALASLPHINCVGNPQNTLRIACQQYPWRTYYGREQQDQKDWKSDLSVSMAELVETGFEGFEPTFETTADIEPTHTALVSRNIWATSMYVNSVLHDPAEVEKSIEMAFSIAKASKSLGIKIVVTNPSPIQWGGPENKTDAQLILQAKALNELGKKLRGIGLVLAYHNHDAEMREGAREFHHMLVGTEPENVSLCLDSHWVYRGAGNSQVALLDVVKLYGDRIVEWHLRQSQNGVWTEAFGPGDLDYEKLAEVLLSRNIRPHLVMEQAVEEGSPHTLNAVEAHRTSLAYAREIFADFG